MASTSVSAKYFRLALRQIANNIIWKDMHKATVAEKELHVDTVYTDRFTTSVNRLFEYYSRSQLEALFKYTTANQERFIANAPSRYQPALRTLLEYEEPNNYYRMLAGLPNVGADKKYLIYLEPTNPWGFSSEIPVHEMPYTQIQIIENAGLLDRAKSLALLDKNFNYVFYMTTKKVQPFISRTADRFDLLYCPASELEALSNDFADVYMECKNYIIQNFYSEAYKYKYEFYEGFMAMSILFMTLQRMCAKYLEADITRDFYDLDSIKVVYEAYSVPFYSNIPVSYHKKIIKLINALLSYKGSDAVFFDLLALFDYGSLQIYEYFLFKEHKLDENGNPIFLYKKTIDPETGESITTDEYDLMNMYDIKFAKRVKGESVYRSVTDTNNYLDYSSVINADPYWIHDQDLIDKMYQMEYNFIETKYIGLQMQFSMTKFFFESAYFMRMILDNKDKMLNIYINIGRFGSDVDLFTFIVYIHAAICRNLGYAGKFGWKCDADTLGRIAESPAKISRVYGFNYKEDMQTLIDFVINNKDLDPLHSERYARLITAIEKTNIDNEESVSTAYNAIVEIYEIIEDSLMSTHKPRVYFAYKHLQKLMLTTELNHDIFNKDDGTHAESYMEMLEDLNPLLALRLQGLSEEDLDIEVEYCLTSLLKVCNNLAYIQMFGTSTVQVITDYLYNLLRFFKSAKAQLIDFKIIYLIDSRVNNLLKLMEQFRDIRINTDVDDRSFGNDLFDFISMAFSEGILHDDQNLKDFLLNDSMFVVIRDIVFKGDKIKAITKMSIKDISDFFDYLDQTIAIVQTKDPLTIVDHALNILRTVRISDTDNIIFKNDLKRFAYAIIDNSFTRNVIEFDSEIVKAVHKVLLKCREVILDSDIAKIHAKAKVSAGEIKFGNSLSYTEYIHPIILWPNLGLPSNTIIYDGKRQVAIDPEGKLYSSKSLIPKP